MKIPKALQNARNESLENYFSHDRICREGREVRYTFLQYLLSL